MTGVAVPGTNVVTITGLTAVLPAGQLVVSLFVFIQQLDYTNGCLSSIFYVAAVVLVAQDTHVGSKLNAAAFVIGPLWFGSVIAGCVVSLLAVTSQTPVLQPMPDVCLDGP